MVVTHFDIFFEPIYWWLRFCWTHLRRFAVPVWTERRSVEFIQSTKILIHLPFIPLALPSLLPFGCCLIKLIKFMKWCINICKVLIQPHLAQYLAWQGHIECFIHHFSFLVISWPLLLNVRAEEHILFLYHCFYSMRFKIKMEDEKIYYNLCKL